MMQHLTKLLCALNPIRTFKSCKNTFFFDTISSCSYFLVNFILYRCTPRNSARGCRPKEREKFYRTRRSAHSGHTPLATYSTFSTSKPSGSDTSGKGMLVRQTVL